MNEGGTMPSIVPSHVEADHSRRYIRGSYI